MNLMSYLHLRNLQLRRNISFAYNRKAIVMYFFKIKLLKNLLLSFGNDLRLGGRSQELSLSFFVWHSSDSRLAHEN